MPHPASWLASTTAAAPINRQPALCFAQHLQFTTVSGGISNVNAKLTPKAELNPVMFKVFGDKTEQIIDRDAERVVVVALGQQGFGPKVREKGAIAAEVAGPWCSQGL
jgi:hypothetical protein